MKNWEQEFDKIENEWKKHRTMNKCSICDSPNGHTTIKKFIRRNFIPKSEMKELERKLNKHIKDFEKNPSGITFADYERGMKYGLNTAKQILKKHLKEEQKNGNSK